MMEIKQLGRRRYREIYEAMQAFTDARDAHSVDELWVVEHEPVFTQGKAGRPEHLLDNFPIEVVQTDRGGQITYHGPGQLVIYTMIDFERRHISVRELVNRIENAIIATLADYQLDAYADEQRPGVYIDGKKIASLGLRIRHNAVYHGLALNVDMDLSPFDHINPCGYAGLTMCQMADFLTPCPTVAEVAQPLCQYLIDKL